MKKIYIALLTLFVIGSARQQVFAGFPIGKYRSIVVPSFSYYSSKDTYNREGKRIAGSNGTGFTSYAFGLYMGYGITRRLDLLVNLVAPFQTSKFATADGIISQASSGLGDLQVGLSYALINFNYNSYLSVQVSGIAPLYNNNNKAVALGYGSYGSEIKMMYSGGLSGKFKGYYNLEAGYRRFFDYLGPDVFIYSATLGTPIPGRNQITAEVGGQSSSSNDKSFSQNLSINRDFSFTKAGLGFGHTFTRRFSLFANGFYTFRGYNSGVGSGVSMQAVLKI